MEKVNWRHQYKLDNIFNIIVLIMILISTFLNIDVLTYILILVSLYINGSAAKFFTSNYN